MTATSPPPSPHAPHGMRIERFSSPSALVHGLREIRRRGVTPRGLLFAALDPHGEIYLGIPEDADAVSTIKVGEKLGLRWPIEGRFFHFDSVHRLPGNQILFNGDRRLAHPGDAEEAVELIADFLKTAGAKNVFFGCTPHQPGSWLLRDAGTFALHERGMAETVPVPQGVLARRVVDDRLFFLPSAALHGPLEGDPWLPVYKSPLGNLLMLERRVIADRLVLTCEGGLVEVDLSGLPVVQERAHVRLDTGFGVVGRVEGTAFAVTTGTPMPWGLDDMQPAVLIGASGASLQDLGVELTARRAHG